jgi:hypothetical protein
LALCAVAALGCGGGGAAGSSSCDGGCWQPTTADQSFISSFCALSEACCVANALEPQAAVPSCETTLQKSGVSGDPGLQASCLAEMQSLSGSLDCVPEIWNLTDPCVRMFDERSGPQGPGQPCTTNADCAGPPGTIAICSPDPSSVNLSRAFCLRLEPGQAGDHTCLGNVNANGAIVAAAFYRASSGAAPLTSGFVCEQSKGLYCFPSDDPMASACTPFAADGATCDYDTIFCASGTCVGATSSGQLGTCASTVGIGQTCAASGVQATCDDTSYCASNGTSTSTCAAKLDTGGACTSDGACASGNCVSDLCSAQTGTEVFALFAFCTHGL